MESKIKFLVAIVILTLLVLIPLNCTIEKTGIHLPSTSPTYSTCSIDMEYLNDYDYLWSLIERDYPYLSVVKTMLNLDPVHIKAEYREKIARIHGDIEFFNEIIVPCLAEFERIGHLSVVTEEDYIREYHILKELFQGEGLSPYGAHNFTQFNMPQVKTFYSTINVRPDRLTTYADQIRPTFNTLVQTTTKANENLQFEYFPDMSTAYISIESMTMPFENNDSNLLNTFFREIEASGYKNCIIDIKKTAVVVIGIGNVILFYRI